MKHIAFGVAAAALLVFSPPVSATTVTSGDVVNVDWTEPVTGTGGVQATLSGTLKLSAFDFSGLNSVTFTVQVTNDTQQGSLTPAQLASVRLVAFAFDTNPDATNVSD